MTKPMWALLAEEAKEMEKAVLDRRVRSDNYRCKVTVILRSGTRAQCTGDTVWENPNHVHRYDTSELPA
jgi:hypothetical protein